MLIDSNAQMHSFGIFRSPVAVGQTGLSSSDMYESAMRGKGVVILHCYQDQLW